MDVLLAIRQRLVTRKCPYQAVCGLHGAYGARRDEVQEQEKEEDRYSVVLGGLVEYLEDRDSGWGSHNCVQVEDAKAHCNCGHEHRDEANGNGTDEDKR